MDRDRRRRRADRLASELQQMIADLEAVSDRLAQELQRDGYDTSDTAPAEP